MSEDECKQLITYIAALWPRFEVVPGITWKAWFTLFATVEYRAATLAVAHFAKTAQHPHPPCAPEIFAVLEELKKTPEERATASEAWEQVVKVGRLAPDRRAGKLTQRAQRALDRVGGWMTYGLTQLSEVPFLRNRFFEAYAELTEDRRLEVLGRNEAAALLSQVEKVRLNGSTKRIGRA